MVKERGNIVLKIVDRWVGIPLVILLSIFKKISFKRSKLTSTRPQRIGLLIPAAIGDTLVAEVGFKLLQAQFPQAELVAFASQSNASVFKLIPSIKKVVILPIKKPWKAISKIRKEAKFDWWIDYGQWARLNAILSFFAKADYKVGFKTQAQYRHYIYDQTVTHSKEQHEVKNFLSLLKALGVNTQNAQYTAPPQTITNKQNIIIHMFAGGTKPYLKEWPPEYWKELIQSLVHDGYSVTLTGVKDNQVEANHFINSLENPNAIINAVGKWDLQKLSDEMKKSFLVISVNTGVMHLAASLACNLISLQGPTSVKRWGPLNKNSIAIQSKLSCSPCLNLGFEYGCPYNNCMKAISVKEVHTAINQFK